MRCWPEADIAGYDEELNYQIPFYVHKYAIIFKSTTSYLTQCKVDYKVSLKIKQIILKQILFKWWKQEKYVSH